MLDTLVPFVKDNWVLVVIALVVIVVVIKLIKTVVKWIITLIAVASLIFSYVTYTPDDVKSAVSSVTEGVSQSLKEEAVKLFLKSQDFKVEQNDGSSFKIVSSDGSVAISGNYGETTVKVHYKKLTFDVPVDEGLKAVIEKYR
mgnify:CR=1 FL=1